MNKMYEYLQEHNYISKNKNKNPLRQQELSKERADAIACKCENIMKEEKQELINYLKEQINECKLSGYDEDYVRADVYEEILSKIEKR